MAITIRVGIGDVEEMLSNYPHIVPGFGIDGEGNPYFTKDTVPVGERAVLALEEGRASLSPA